MLNPPKCSSLYICLVVEVLFCCTACSLLFRYHDTDLSISSAFKYCAELLYSLVLHRSFWRYIQGFPNTKVKLMRKVRQIEL
ncbi:hypothetical protein BDV96DRAFT_587515 [Lophiotrema nucula]|uniref:Uncharacterized protein n=1 Tax=Lophiotrema nucula TaxID=690887 RepID=A0A6A5YMF8_9PLEO|nr:hypothetical protein BDV96DRAFT_587515 [Lophiotrema nucula]